jgi:NDP-sugar pyrophosphorylase family protein
MDAMIFAAGLGTRLRPLTDAIPKALVTVGGVPMLERVARRLVEAGATRLVINVCPFAARIEDFVVSRGGFGVECVISREAPAPLETGGGLLAAAPLLRGDGPVVLHNVDVIADLSVSELVAEARRTRSLATLAVMSRPSSRRLLFDDHGLFGRVDDRASLRAETRRPVGPVVSRAFCGVSVVDRRLLDRITERGSFSILTPLLRLAGDGERILPFDADGCQWIDIGRPADLERANRLLAPPVSVR